MFAIVGERLIRYTDEVVLPRIDASLRELDGQDAGAAKQASHRDPPVAATVACPSL